MSASLFSNQHTARRKEGRKSNKAFMILSALGILFVMDVHLGNPIGVLTKIFPYDSFFMPMFAFISGYFVNEANSHTGKDVLNFCISKARKLLLPYLGWTVFYNIISGILYQAGIWNIPALSLRELIYSVITSGVTSAFNSPAWFAPLLFCVSITFCFIRWLFRKAWNDHLAFTLFIVAGTTAICASRTGFNVPLHYMLLKIPFFLQFYYSGCYFRKYWEDLFDRLNIFVVCLSAVAVNIALMPQYRYVLEFPICSSMSGFLSDNPFLPFITSMTGTAFWLKISKFLVPFIGTNRLINEISDHTFFIMTHHIGVKHLFIGLCLLGYRMGLSVFSGIDVQQFLSDGLYLYNSHSWCTPICFVFSVTVLLLFCRGWDCLKKTIRAIIVKKRAVT